MKLARVAIFSLGCKVNQVESEQMKEEFSRLGFTVVPWGEPADVMVINTCTVTHVGERKSRAILRRARRLSPQALVVAVGCLAEEKGRELQDLGVDLVVGNQNKEYLPELVAGWMTGIPFEGGCRFALARERKLRPVFFRERHERTRAMVKIEDGCESRCSYCIVSRLRGPVVVKSPQDTVDEVRHLVGLGYREIVLTGIHIGQYRHPEVGGLSGLVSRVLSAVPGEYRLRLGSVEINELDDPLLELMALDSRLCRHLHLPLQSGSDRVLSLMNRHYTREQYAEKVKKAADLIPGLMVSIDVMVGFPGETEADFADTVGLVSSLPLVHAHIFRYSRRPGTPAAVMSGQIPEKAKEERAHFLERVASGRTMIMARRMIGKETVVLAEEENDGYWTGLSDHYWRVRFKLPHEVTGELCRVLISGGTGDLLTAHYLGPTTSLR